MTATWNIHMSDDSHAIRLAAIERRSEGHSDRLQRVEDSLSDGRVEFAEIRKDLHALTAAVNGVMEQLQRSAGVNWGHEILKALITWGVPVGIIALVWLLTHSGAVKVAP